MINEEFQLDNINNLENDPLEEIFALNLGDFLTEHLISDDLLSKINSSEQDKVTKLKNQLQELVSIYSLDKTLKLLGFDSDDDFVIYNSIAKTATQMLDIDACQIYLASEYTSNLKHDLVLVGSSHSDMNSCVSKDIGLNISDEKNPLITAFLTGKTLKIDTKECKDWATDKALCPEKVLSTIIVPMKNQFESVGIICLESYSEKEIMPELIKLIQCTAKLFVTSMKLQELVEEANNMIDTDNVSVMDLRQVRTELTASIGDLGDEQQMFVERLASAVDAKGHYAKKYSEEVADIAREISRYLKLNEKTVDLIYYAGLLHNIGKITLPGEIFSNNKLSQEDWLKLQNHPNVGVSLLMKINFLSEVVPYVHYHKERWDGKGEPEGLAGLSIPLGSRIIAVADAYQAMKTPRTYRENLSNAEILNILKTEAGIKWDPVIIDALYNIKRES